MKNEFILVTGANGHLGYNLVTLLVNKGYRVRASIRKPEFKKLLENTGCEVVIADITDQEAMRKAMKGITIVFAVASVFKLWAKNPKSEIYDVNMNGCKVTLETAAENGVKRIIYVSSIASLNYSSYPINEKSGYNTDRRDMYYNSKNDSEQLAFKLAEKYNIELIAVLPSAMIGSEIIDRLSNSNEILKNIIKNKLPIETHININWIDVKDVAEGCYLAAINGKNGERYIIANEKGMSITDTIKIANLVLPQLNISKPIKISKWILYLLGYSLGIISKITKKAPAITEKEISMFYGLVQDFDISKARTELKFSPTSPELTLKNAFEYMWRYKSKLLN
ncbi:NAD-dependent epimerase/dehydratase family protein [Apibacter raozihei]|nr:NAD-dependent epimerase/dehydratase family protein [Apibacter raozihei]